MARLPNLPLRYKVYAYILRERSQSGQLLVFEHLDFPEAGIQVPGGTVEPGEEFSVAVLREAAEETRLEGLRLEEQLGAVRRDMRGFGLKEVHHRVYYYLSCMDCEKETWIAFEESPSDGSEGPIAFRFYWVDLAAVPSLLGGLDEMLPKLMQRL